MNTHWKIIFRERGIETTVDYTARGILDAIQQFIEANHSIKEIIKVEIFS